MKIEGQLRTVKLKLFYVLPLSNDGRAGAHETTWPYRHRSRSDDRRLKPSRRGSHAQPRIDRVQLTRGTKYIQFPRTYIGKELDGA
eukprot:1482256-Pleurochrysis_carterae.AAC.1